MSTKYKVRKYNKYFSNRQENLEIFICDSALLLFFNAI